MTSAPPQPDRPGAPAPPQASAEVPAPPGAWPGYPYPYPEAHPYPDAYPYPDAHPYPGAYAPSKPDRITRFFQRFWYGPPVWAAPAALLVCMAGAVAYTEVTHPAEAAAGDAPTCLLKYTTGFVCPGCGGTRAAWYLLHGNLPAAARHHAIFVFAVPFLLYLYVAWAGKRVFGWTLPPLTLSPKVIGIFLAVWGVWSVARNLPWAPFTSFYV